MKTNEFISVALFIILLAFIFFMIIRRTYRQKLNLSGEIKKFVYLDSIKFFAIYLAASISLLILTAVNKGVIRAGTDTYIAYAVIIVITILVILISLHFIFYKVILSPMGIEKRVRFSKQSVAWDEINNIRFSKDRRAYIVETQSGQELKISKLLEGGSTLIECLNIYLDPSKLMLGEANTTNKVHKREARIKIFSAAVFFVISMIVTVIYVTDELNYKNIKMKEYVSPDGTFSVLLPKEPDRKVDTSMAKDGRTFETIRFETKEKGYIFIVCYSEYPATLRAQEMMDLYTPSDKLGKLLESKNITLNGYIGKEFHFSNNDGKVILIDRVYCVGSRLYQVIAGFKNEKGREELASKYLNSFRLLKEFNRNVSERKKVGIPGSSAEISIPGNWQSQKNDTGALSAEDVANGIGIVSYSYSKKDFQFLADHSDFHHMITEDIINDAKHIEEHHLTINGNHAIQSKLVHELDGVKRKYLLTTIDMKDHYYSIVLYSLESKYGDYKDQFIDIINSFKES